MISILLMNYFAPCLVIKLVRGHCHARHTRRAVYLDVPAISKF